MAKLPPVAQGRSGSFSGDTSKSLFTVHIDGGGVGVGAGAGGDGCKCDGIMVLASIIPQAIIN